MKKIILIILSFSCICYAAPVIKSSNPNRILLPQNFHVYVLGTTVLTLPPPGPFPGFKEKILPTNNLYRGYPGCYIACYSHNTVNSVYPVGKNIFVQGQLRIPGHYQEKICQPVGYIHQDISKIKHFKLLCKKYIKSCRNCWAGGNTGGWLESKNVLINQKK